MYAVGKPDSCRIIGMSESIPLDAIDQRSLFDAINTIDIYDLARLLKSVETEASREKLFSAMTKAKREEIEDLVGSMERADPVAAQQVEDRLIAAVRRTMSGTTESTERQD